MGKALSNLQLDFDQNIRELASWIRSHQPLVVITGAGCSTESGIFDYRNDAGEWKLEQPVMLDDFLNSLSARQKYWTRSLANWPRFHAAKPNEAHTALASLERRGYVDLLVTQNVDDLHQQAGSKNVVSLHGSLKTVTCIKCKNQVLRQDIQTWLEENNPSYVTHSERILLDSSNEPVPQDAVDLHVPTCDVCDGILKPDVVFFGDSVPADRVETVVNTLRRSRGLMLVGTSAMVYSAFRFCRIAYENDISIVAVNRGHTRADEWLDMHLRESASVVLAATSSLLEAQPRKKFAV